MTVVTFENYTPTPRYDGDPWVSARIEESLLDTGPWTPLETVVLDPVDADPEQPAPRYFTTEEATLALGWYRIVWIDGDGNEQPTLPVVNVPAPIWQPEPADVAKVVSAYSSQFVGGYTNGGREVDHFTNETDPTLSRVQGFIVEAVNEVHGRAGVAVLPEQVWPLARSAALWHAAASVAAKRQPNTGEDQPSGLYRAFISNYVASLNDLKAKLRSLLGYRLL